MYQRIPNRLRPGIALYCFWVLVLLLNLLVDSKVDWDSFFVRSVLWLSWIVIPYTIFAGIALCWNIGGVRGEWVGLGFRAMAGRSVVVLLMFLFAFAPWGQQEPRDGRSLGGHSLRKMAIALQASEIAIEYLEEDYWILDRVPKGETDVSKLPKEILDYFSAWKRADGVDPWGRDYVFVSEVRESGLWMGVYSKGEDGVSLSKGNDPDDLTTWSTNRFEYYKSKQYQRNRAIINNALGILMIAALFLVPICFLTFRRPYFPESHIA